MKLKMRLFLNFLSILTLLFLSFSIDEPNCVHFRRIWLLTTNLCRSYLVVHSMDLKIWSYDPVQDQQIQTQYVYTLMGLSALHRIYQRQVCTPPKIHNNTRRYGDLKETLKIIVFTHLISILHQTLLLFNFVFNIFPQYMKILQKIHWFIATEILNRLKRCVWKFVEFSVSYMTLFCF